MFAYLQALPDHTTVFYVSIDHLLHMQVKPIYEDYRYIQNHTFEYQFNAVWRHRNFKIALLLQENKQKSS
jgi:hypothetical protein